MNDVMNEGGGAGARSTDNNQPKSGSDSGGNSGRNGGGGTTTWAMTFWVTMADNSSVNGGGQQHGPWEEGEAWGGNDGVGAWQAVVSPSTALLPQY